MIRLFFSTVALLTTFFLLNSCDSFGTDNAPTPSPLPVLSTNIAPVKLTPLWHTDVGKLGDDYFHYTVAQDGKTLFTVNKHGLLLASNAETNARLWRMYFSKTIIAGPVILQGILYLSTDDGKVYAIDPKAGKELWHAQLPNQVYGQPTVQGNSIYIKTVDDEVFSLDATTGKKNWSYVGDAPQLVLRAGSTPLLSDGKVFVGFANGLLIALSQNKGLILWQQAVALPQGASEVERMVDVTVTPVADNHLVYVASYQGYIAAYRTDNGAGVWRHRMSSYTGIALSEKALFITDAQGELWSFDKATGAVNWRQPALNYRGLTAPVVWGNKILVGDSLGYIHVIDQTSGEFIGRLQVSDQGIVNAPFVEGNKLYVLTRDGLVTAVRI